MLKIDPTAIPGLENDIADKTKQRASVRRNMLRRKNPRAARKSVQRNMRRYTRNLDEKPTLRISAISCVETIPQSFLSTQGLGIDTGVPPSLQTVIPILSPIPQIVPDIEAVCSTTVTSQTGILQENAPLSTGTISSPPTWHVRPDEPDIPLMVLGMESEEEGEDSELDDEEESGEGGKRRRHRPGVKTMILGLRECNSAYIDRE